MKIYFTGNGMYSGIVDVCRVWWNYILQGYLLDVRDKGAVRIKKFTPLRLLNKGFDFESLRFILILCFCFCQISVQFLCVF